MSTTATTTTNASPAEARIVRGHTHEHLGGPHEYTRTEAASTPRDAAATASVMLDIGAGLGALVIYPGKRFRGLEIEISRVDGDGPRVHTGVHERTTRTGSMLTAIFGSLPAGEYLIWEDETTDGPVITVPEGAVAELHLT